MKVAPQARKYPTGFVVTFAVLGLLAFAYSIAFLRSGDAADRAGFFAGPMFLWFAWAAHRRATSGGVDGTFDNGDRIRQTMDADGKRTLNLTLALEVPQQVFPTADQLIVRPLYSLLKTPQPIEMLGDWWAGNDNGFREVVGFTSLGDVFLRNPDTSVYAVLWPLRKGNNASTLEKCASHEEFEQRFLKDREHSVVILDPLKVARLKREFGALEPGQVYIPVPYPMLAAVGGPRSAPPTWEKGDFWTFINLVGQFCERFA